MKHVHKNSPPCDRTYKMYYKSGGATILIAKNMTYTGVKFLGKMIEDYLEKHNTKLEGSFLKPLK